MLLEISYQIGPMAYIWQKTDIWKPKTSFLCGQFLTVRWTPSHEYWSNGSCFCVYSFRQSYNFFLSKLCALLLMDSVAPKWNKRTNDPRNSWVFFRRRELEYGIYKSNNTRVCSQILLHPSSQLVKQVNFES